MFKSGKETKALLLLGCYKIGFALLCVGLLFASADQGWFNESQFERVFQKWPLEGEANLASYLAAWDGAHYLELAKLGYRPGDSSCAFYPLWPHLVRWVAPLTGGNLVVAGLLLANLFSFVGALLFYRLAKRGGEPSPSREAAKKRVPTGVRFIAQGCNRRRHPWGSARIRKTLTRFHTCQRDRTNSTVKTVVPNCMGSKLTNEQNHAPMP